MFEGFTLEKQREIELERGWKPTYSALTYCTAEAVLFRGEGPFINREILIAERTSGAPDCLGKTQGKWGTYVKPTDRNAQHAIHRAVKELFGLVIDGFRAKFAGIIGPELYKTKVILKPGGQDLVLVTTEVPAEQTPFEAKLFCVDLTGLEIDPEGSYSKSTRNARWVTLDNLIKEHGDNTNFLYWNMVVICLLRLALGETSYPSPIITEFIPGKDVHYFLPLQR